MRFAIAIVSAVLIAPVQAADLPTACRVVAIADGDTLTVLDDTNTQHKVRLAGIDAPERGQPFGTKARERLGELAMGKDAMVHAEGRDKYGRVIARIEIGGKDVGQRMVADGLAWHYTRFDKDPRLAAAEQAARAARRGLWADKEPVAPWEWRASEKRR